MSLYGEVLSSIQVRLSKLSREQVFSVVVACVRYAYLVNYPRFAASVTAEHLAAVEEELGRLQSAIEKKPLERDVRRAVKVLADLYPDESSWNHFVSGWRCVLESAGNAWRVLTIDDYLQQASRSMDAAYQAIVDEEMKNAMADSGAGLCGDEINEFEKESSRCLAAIGFHLSCVKSAEAGRTPEVPQLLNDMPALQTRIEDVEARIGRLRSEIQPRQFRELAKHCLSTGESAVAQPLDLEQTVRRLGELENLLEHVRQHVARQMIERLEREALERYGGMSNDSDSPDDDS